MMSDYRQKLGRWGEKTAIDYLLGEGFEIIDRNVRTPYGEIDIIAKLLDLYVFIEVKARSTASLGMPEISITRKKRKHIIEAIEFYIQNHPEFNHEWRIDVIAVRRRTEGKGPEIAHFQNAITDE